MKHKFFQPAIPREVYTMRAVERQWPSGEWVETEPPARGSMEGGDKSSSRSTDSLPVTPPSITIIGGTKYDQDALEDYLSNPALDSFQFIIGDGRGAEHHAGVFCGSAQIILADPDRFGKLARKVNVEQVLCTSPDSPVLLVGKGERVKQAKSVLQRANWGREVIELP